MFLIAILVTTLLFVSYLVSVRSPWLTQCSSTTSNISCVSFFEKPNKPSISSEDSADELDDGEFYFEDPNLNHNEKGNDSLTSEEKFQPEPVGTTEFTMPFDTTSTTASQRSDSSDLFFKSEGNDIKFDEEMSSTSFKPIQEYFESEKPVNSILNTDYNSASDPGDDSNHFVLYQNNSIKTFINNLFKISEAKQIYNSYLVESNKEINDLSRNQNLTQYPDNVRIIKDFPSSSDSTEQHLNNTFLKKMIRTSEEQNVNIRTGSSRNREGYMFYKGFLTEMPITDTRRVERDLQKRRDSFINKYVDCKTYSEPSAQSCFKELM